MKFSLYVTQNQTGDKVLVVMKKARLEDLKATSMSPLWQTDWNTDYIRNSGFELYALKTEAGELVALGAYEVCVDTIAVHIVYMESQAESNPTLAKDRKYRNVGRAMIAFGIKLSVDAGFNGDVTLDGKTAQLEAHYRSAYGAIKLPGRNASAAPRYLICAMQPGIFLHCIWRRMKHDGRKMVLYP